MNATLHPAAVLIECPKCKRTMNTIGTEARCPNQDCDDFDKQFTLEMPKLEVKLTLYPKVN